MADLIKNVDKSTVFEIAGIADCEPGAVNSVTLAQQPGCKMTVLAFGDGESIAAHSAPGDALSPRIPPRATPSSPASRARAR